MHRADLAAGDLVVEDDIPLTSPLRTAWDTAALEPVSTAVAALDGMTRAGSVTRQQLLAMDVRVDGEFLGRVDLAFPEARVVIEHEGAYHFEGTQIARDDGRYALMEKAGWVVIRLSAADLRDLDRVVARVRAALEAAGALQKWPFLR